MIQADRRGYTGAMTIARREFLVLAAAAGGTVTAAAHGAHVQPASKMYGLIGKMTAVAGKRDELLAILLESTQAMPGCLSYVLATDPADADALWITEVWVDAASHRASLTLPAVQAAIAKGRPLIAGFSNRVETIPIGGAGLARP
jgi:quinol monooxygenase YgiN